MSHTLIVLPDDSAQPLVDALTSARTSLRIRLSLSADPTLQDAVLAARRRGVDVRVMLNPAKGSEKAASEVLRRALESAGAEVIEGNPDFAVTRQKSLIVDDALGIVEAIDWEARKLPKTRDYALATRHRHEVEEMAAGFDAEWHRKRFTPAADSRLVWCPDNGRVRIAQFIEAAKHTLFVQNERYQDSVIVERLLRAAHRGVAVHLLARVPRKGTLAEIVDSVGGLRILADVGIKVHTLKGLKLRGKMLLADDKRAIVGSINLAPGVFDARRELAIETDEPAVVKRLARTAKHDWADSHRIDLSDEALRREIERRAERDAAKAQSKS
jgi:phosphatidylserine/phosphatidylglycerophosphate/cardiolipin synthase-like enzyme